MEAKVLQRALFPRGYSSKAPIGRDDPFLPLLLGGAEDSADLRIFEERRVRIDAIVGLIIKPQEWSNFRSALSLSGIWRFTEIP